MFGFQELLNGFITAFSLVNIVACFIGVLLGTIVGVLPGLGPTATMSLMLPLTLKYSPVTGLIMMAGIFYGANYGGSTTSILVNMPGEASSVVSCIDGFQMTKKGRGGAALAVAAISSFVAGTIGIIGLQIFAPPLTQLALSFGPPEYLALMIFSFIILSNLTGGSPYKSFLMIAFGLWIGTIGIDPMGYGARFTFGLEGLLSGVDFIPMAMGLFGVTEILTVASEKYLPGVVEKIRFRDLYPNRSELHRSIFPILRGSILGFFVGLLPGPSPAISTFLAYSLERRLSKTPQEFGKGMVEGVAGPESANNSAVTGSMIPLLTLGIPFAPPTAVLLAALRMQNVELGPFLFEKTPDIFWGFIASMYIGNVFLLILNLPLVGVFARIAKLRPQILMPIVSIICLIGVYSVRNSVFDIWIMIFAGILGLFLRKWGFPIAPLIIGLVLGTMAENSYRQSCMMFMGDVSLIFQRPIAVALLSLSLLSIVFTVAKSLKKAGG